MAAPDFLAVTVRSLGARAALICSNPRCNALTVGPADATGDLATKLGEAAHIRAARPGQARFDSNMTDDERAEIANGIWLCASCHTMVDKNNGAGFPASTLERWKAEHEATLRSLLMSHRSPLPLLRKFTEEGKVAQELVDVLEQHGALFMDHHYEVTSHVVLSVERLRDELRDLQKAIRYDTRLKNIVKDLASECRRFMNHTSRFPGNQRAELDALRTQVGVRLLQLVEEYGCSIHGPIARILP